MEEGLKIRIGADVVEVTQSINQLEKDLKGLEQQLKSQTGQAFIETNKQIERLKDTISTLRNVGRTGFDEFGSKATQVAKSVGGLRTSTSQATFALGNFNRVVQDAPFGFIGIQNNIEPLFQSFQQLKQETGSTGGAFRALATSLAGPAGVLFAFSAVTSIVTVLVQKYGSLGNAFAALANSGNAYYKQQQELVALQKDAAKIAGDELARLDLLNNVAQDTTNSTDNRREAAKKLLDVYKEYLPKISEEAILNGQAADAINKAKDAILNKALAAAAEKKLAEIGSKVLENQLAQVKAVEQYGKAQENYRKQAEAASKQELQGREGVNTATVAYLTELDKSKDRLVELGNESLSLDKQYQALLNLATGFAKKAGEGFIKTSEGAKQARKDIKDFAEDFAAYGRFQAGIAAGSLPQTFQRATETLLGDAQANADLQVPLRITIPTETFEALNRFGKARKDAFDNEILKQQIAEFKELLALGLAQPLGDLIFNFLEQGKFGFKAFADAAISSIKRIVAQIIASKIIQLLGRIATAGFTGGGGLLGSLFGGVFGGGGGVGANIGGLAGGSLLLGGSVSLVARGTDLVGVVGGGNARIGRVG